jgi:shikimate dehydrogenase
MRPYRFAVLGDPVEHSRSPAIHTTMLEMSGLRGEYLRIRADSRILAATLDELRTGRWDGLNVTMPLKSAAAELADTLSPQAERSRSVNTLALRQDHVDGHSTDSTTFLSLVMGERFAALASILVLGSGGSAAAALASLAPHRHVYVAGRRRDQAEMLARRLGGHVVSWGAGVAGALVINTTPLGMAGERLPEGILESAAGLIDLPYRDQPTPAILEADRVDIPWVDGHEFLIRQAIESFEIWTGLHVDFAALEAGLRKA